MSAIADNDDDDNSSDNVDDDDNDDNIDDDNSNDVDDDDNDSKFAILINFCAKMRYFGLCVFLPSRSVTLVDGCALNAG